MTEYSDNSTELMLYTNYVQEKDGTIRPVGYAYGKPWVAQALAMGDLSFDSPEAAKMWWEKNYGEEK